MSYSGPVGLWTARLRRPAHKSTKRHWTALLQALGERATTEVVATVHRVGIHIAHAPAM
jgi:hypothetical protein